MKEHSVKIEKGSWIFDYYTKNQDTEKKNSGKSVDTSIQDVQSTKK